MRTNDATEIQYQFNKLETKMWTWNSLENCRIQLTIYYLIFIIQIFLNEMWYYQILYKLENEEL